MWASGVKTAQSLAYFLPWEVGPRLRVVIFLPNVHVFLGSDILIYAPLNDLSFFIFCKTKTYSGCDITQESEMKASIICNKEFKIKIR